MKQRIQLTLQFLLFILISNTLAQITFAGNVSFRDHRGEKESIELTRAKLQHLDQLFSIYDQMADDDRKNLVIIPQQQRRQYLQKAIEQEHFFIAINPAGAIVSLVKLYCECNPEAQYAILHDEIKMQPYCQDITVFESEEVLKQPHIVPDTPVILQDIPMPEKSIFLYYGGAYTAPAYRKRSIHQKLLQYAMTHLCQNLSLSLTKNTRYLLCAYGQVLANKNSISIIYACIQATRLLQPIRDIIQVRRYRYQAFKPELVYNEETQKIEVLENLERNKGFGNVLVIDLDEEPKPFEKYQSMKG